MRSVASLALRRHPAPPPNLVWGEVGASLAAGGQVRQGGLCWRPACTEPPCTLGVSRDCSPRGGEVFRCRLSPAGAPHCTALHCTALHCTALHCRLNTAGQLGLGERCVVPGAGGRLQVTPPLHCTQCSAVVTALHCQVAACTPGSVSGLWTWSQGRMEWRGRGCVALLQALHCTALQSVR
jgi:hypothetical protein